MATLSLRYSLYIVLLSIIASCNVQKTTIAPTPPPEQELVRLKRTNSTKPAIISGQVNVVQTGTNRIPVSSAIIAVDKNISLANDAGYYTLTLSPGTHEFVVGQIGFYQSRFSVEIATGDSINLNFNIQYDSRPTAN